MTPVRSLIRARLLAPTTGPYHLPRPRLLGRLAEGLSGRATLVMAGPGYGKSSLVARFLQDHPGEAVWYRLDASDQDPWMLLRYLSEGIRQHMPEFGERSEGIREALRSSGGPVERLTDTFICDAQESLEGQMTLVLDDVHHVAGGGPAERALRRLLTYLPGTLHLILMGRSLPDLGLSSMRADSSVQTLNGPDLLFTLEETRKLLTETFGLKASDDSVRRLHERTRGWVTALQLLRQTALSRAGSPELPEAVFALTESEIFDYFSEEVFASEPESTRRLLLTACLPATIDPDILQMVLPGCDVRDELRGLVRRSLFIAPLESRTEYYAFDPLFADFLRRKAAEQVGEGGVRDLHRRYARACSARHDVAQALRHWTAASEARQAARLLARHGKELLRAGMIDAVRQSIRFVDERGPRPAALEELLGEAGRLCGDYAAAAGHFEKALAPAGPEPPLEGPARAAALQGLAYSLLKLGEVDKSRLKAEEALACVPAEEGALRARILNTLCLVRYRTGDQPDALAGWQEALLAARRAGDDLLARMIAHNLGLPHAAMGDFARAAECFHILTAPDSPRLGPEEGTAYLNLARIETLMGRLEPAASFLDDAREIAWKWQLPGLKADVLEAEGNLLRESGELDGARVRYAEARALFTELGQQDLLEGLAEEEALLASRRDDHEEAVRLASGCLKRRRAAGDPAGVASALLAAGRTRRAAGDAAGAREALAEAAPVFARLGRAFESCVTSLELASSLLGLGRRDEASASLAAALRLAAQFDYRAVAARALSADPELAGLASALDSAPAWARSSSPAPPLRPAALGAIAPGGADLTIRLLGPIEVYRAPDQHIPSRAWKIRRALHLLCYLASSREHRASKDRLADALWGEARISTIEKNFHPTISLLRRALNHGHNVPKNFILFEGHAYRLNPEYRYDIDIDRFEEAITRARKAAARGEPGEALGGFEEALALYRGPFLDEEYESWAEAPRAHYEALWLAALAEAAQLRLELGDAGAAAVLLGRLVEQNPFDEESSARLMRALGRARDRAGVAQEFERLIRALREELSTGPMPQTRAIYEESLAMASEGIAPRPATL